MVKLVYVPAARSDLARSKSAPSCLKKATSTSEVAKTGNVATIESESLARTSRSKANSARTPTQNRRNSRSAHSHYATALTINRGRWRRFASNDRGTRASRRIVHSAHLRNGRRGMERSAVGNCCCQRRPSGAWGNPAGHEINHGCEFSASTHRKSPSSKSATMTFGGRSGNRPRERSQTDTPQPRTASGLAMRKRTNSSVRPPNQTARLEVNRSDHGATGQRV